MDERLERLERQVRWMRGGLLLAALAVPVSWAWPQEPEDREVVQVRDAEGTVRIELGWNDHGEPGVFLYDDQGRERAAFELARVEPTAPELSEPTAPELSELFPPREIERMPRLVFRDIEGHPRTELYLEDDNHHGDTSHLRFLRHGGGEPLVYLGAQSSWSTYGSLRLTDNQDLAELLQAFGTGGPYVVARTNRTTEGFVTIPESSVGLFPGEEPQVHMLGTQGSRRIKIDD
ncbi:MAG: hypothetical protein O2816_14100 [Planctomycetota bacterium]|nr:hypothetical protein [Planctomycetota bacterium]